MNPAHGRRPSVVPSSWPSLGASLAELGGGVLTHHLLVGSGSGKVALAGAGATGASFALIGGGSPSTIQTNAVQVPRSS